MNLVRQALKGLEPTGRVEPPTGRLRISFMANGKMGQINNLPNLLYFAKLIGLIKPLKKAQFAQNFCQTLPEKWSPRQGFFPFRDPNFLILAPPLFINFTVHSASIE
jgi:hypothetical protein